jgi:ADP-dependent NAD(P)H-hydrate dehydratase / NAD(P)H-hydrate epimerase
MRIFEPEELREIDRYTIQELGISGQGLMKRAARSVYEEIIKLKKGGKVSVLAGKGNNGADALITARYLASDGFDVKVSIFTPKHELSDDTNKILTELVFMGVSVEFYGYDSDIAADIIVDGMFGTGFKGSLSERFIEAIKKINDSDAYVISVDTPSGLDPKTGEVRDVCVEADLTVTFGGTKTGFYMGLGPQMTGKVVLKDIGFPDEAFAVIHKKRYTIENVLIKDILPKRRYDSNKGSFGKTLIIAGSDEMPGAGILAAKAAYRTGAGYVYCLTGEHNRMIYSVCVPEVIHVKEIDGMRYDSIAIGPGLGDLKKTKELVLQLFEYKDLKLIIDADALNSIDDKEILKKAKARLLLTPHPGEMSRLTGMSIQEIQRDRINICSSFSSEYGVITLLKGAYTVISDEEGNVYVNTTGNDALAKAGSGDVLTGMTAGFSAYCDLFEAAVMGAYLHGYCADVFIQDKSSFSLTASEIVDHLPKALKKAGVF